MEENYFDSWKYDSLGVPLKDKGYHNMSSEELRRLMENFMIESKKPAVQKKPREASTQELLDSIHEALKKSDALGLDKLSAIELFLEQLEKNGGLTGLASRIDKLMKEL